MGVFKFQCVKLFFMPSKFSSKFSLLELIGYLMPYEKDKDSIVYS